MGKDVVVIIISCFDDLIVTVEASGRVFLLLLLVLQAGAVVDVRRVVIVVPRVSDANSNMTTIVMATSGFGYSDATSALKNIISNLSLVNGLLVHICAPKTLCNQQILAYCKYNIRNFFDEIGSCSVIELFLRFDRNNGETRPLFYFNFVLYQTMVKPRPLFRFYFGLCQTILQKNANFSRIRT